MAKKLGSMLFGVFLILLSFNLAFSANYGQVSVTNAATLVYGGGAYKVLAIQNQGSAAVYCGPDANVTTGNGPILLVQYAGYVFENGMDAVYCVSGSSTTVGWYLRTLSP